MKRSFHVNQIVDADRLNCVKRAYRSFCAPMLCMQCSPKRSGIGFTEQNHQPSNPRSGFIPVQIPV